MNCFVSEDKSCKERKLASDRCMMVDERARRTGKKKKVSVFGTLVEGERGKVCDCEQGRSIEGAGRRRSESVSMVLLNRSV